MTTPAKMTCAHCKGTGLVDIGADYQATLDLLTDRGPLTAEAIHRIVGKRDGVGVSAINNRLEWLRREGRVIRRKHSRQFIYQVIR